MAVGIVDPVVVMQLVSARLEAFADGFTGVEVTHLGERPQADVVHGVRVSGLDVSPHPRHREDVSPGSADVTLTVAIQTKVSDTGNLASFLALCANLAQAFDSQLDKDSPITHRIQYGCPSYRVIDAIGAADPDDHQLLAAILTIPSMVQRETGTDLTDPTTPT